MQNAKIKNVGYYKSIKQNTPALHLDRFDVYRQIMTDATLKQATDTIITKYRDNIKSGVKHPDYQTDKTKLLPAVCFSISGTREGDNIGKHTGLINLDIDENSASELRAFRKKLENIPFIEAAGLSVSGSVNGSLWCNIRVNIPDDFSSIPAKYATLFKLTEQNYTEKLHKYYYSVFVTYLSENYNITVSESKNDLKRARYLSFDDNLYVNQEARYFDFGFIEKHLQEHKEQQEQREYYSILDSVATGNAFADAELYAQRKTGSECVKGNAHNYITMMSICLNRLGIQEQEAKEYILSRYNGIQIKSNCFSPFKKYKADFGIDSALLKQQPKNSITFNWFAESGNRYYLSDALKHHKIEYKSILGNIVKADTGYGKTSLLLKIHSAGEPIALLTPTKTAAEQAYNEALKQGIKAVLFTGENDFRVYSLISEIEYLPMIFATYSCFKSLDRLLMNLSVNYNLVQDEMHTATADFIYFDSIYSILDAQHRYKTFTGITATPLKNVHPVLDSMPLFDVIIPDKPKASARIILTECIDKTAANLYRQALKEGKTPAVYMNNTGDRLQLFCERLTDVSPTVLNSLTKDSTAFQDIVKHKRFTGQYGFVFTDVLAFATSIANIPDAVIIFSDSVHPDDKAIQIPNRCRDAKIETVFLIGDESESTESPKSDKTKYFLREGNRLKIEAEKRAQGFNDQIQSESFDFEYSHERERLQKRYIRYNKGEFAADYLRISNGIYNAEKSYFNADAEILKQRLQDNNFDVLEIECSEDVLTSTESMEKKIRKQEREALQEQIFNDTVNHLRRCIAPEQEAAKLSEQKGTDKYQKRILKGFLGIFNAVPDDKFTTAEKRAESLNILERSEGKSLKLVISKTRLKDMDFNRDSRRFSQELIKKISTDKAYTPDELKQIVCDCLRFAEFIDKTGINRIRKQNRITGVLKIIKPYFEYKRHGKDKDTYILTAASFDWTIKKPDSIILSA